MITDFFLNAAWFRSYELSPMSFLLHCVIIFFILLGGSWSAYVTGLDIAVLDIYIYIYNVIYLYIKIQSWARYSSIIKANLCRCDLLPWKFRVRYGIRRVKIQYLFFEGNGRVWGMPRQWNRKISAERSSRLKLEGFEKYVGKWSKRVSQVYKLLGRKCVFKGV